MPKVSSISKTITARSRDSISSSLKGVSRVTAFEGSFMFLRRISMILVATSSISLSLPPDLRGPCPIVPQLGCGPFEGKLGLEIDLKTGRVHPALVPIRFDSNPLITNKIGAFWPFRASSFPPSHWNPKEGETEAEHRSEWYMISQQDENNRICGQMPLRSANSITRRGSR